MSHAFIEHNTTISLVTSAFSFSMVIIGLSFALMMITVYLLRLITSGPPDAALILSAFITLGPLGQGGFSLLVNGMDLSELLPLHMGDKFPTIALAGQMIFAGCFLGAYALFSMGVAWILLALISIAHVRSTASLPFSMAYWGTIFPNGVFALLCVQMSVVLDSPVFRAIGAAWSGQYPLPQLTFKGLTLVSYAQESSSSSGSRSSSAPSPRSLTGRCSWRHTCPPHPSQPRRWCSTRRSWTASVATPISHLLS